MYRYLAMLSTVRDTTDEVKLTQLTDDGINVFGNDLSYDTVRRFTMKMHVKCNRFKEQQGHLK